MTDMIKLNYNLEAQNLIEKNDKYFFSSNKMFFMLCPCYRTNQELNDLYKLCEELKMNNIPVHTFILNKESKITTSIFNQKFILLKIEDPEREYNIIDMLNLTNQLQVSKNKSELYRNQWEKLWKEKINYFEFQIHELGKEKKVTLNSFTYYVGLAENAISYVNQTIKKYNSDFQSNIGLSHKRIDFPNLSINYLNPLNFIFDLKVRDIAEYIKSAFFTNENDAWVELKTFLKNKRLNEFEYQMFYARLLFPTYYFDIYEQVMNKEKEEKEMLKYIKKSSEYEDFLNKVYIEISKIVNIDKIDWITEKNAQNYN